LKIAQLTDSDLIVRIKNGDEVAFELVFYKYKGKLYDFVRRSLSEEEDPESIVQEVFVKLWMNRAELDPQQSFNGYIYTIARNEIYGHLRKQLTRKKYQEELLHQLTDSSNTTDRQIEYQELERIISKLIEEMPEKRREIFRESRMEGLSYREISEKLHISENTVDTQIRKALGFLKTKLRNYYSILFFTFF
jgi:RNA polymerase sigma-70 factor (ECF subfamily)